MESVDFDHVEKEVEQALHRRLAWFVRERPTPYGDLEGYMKQSKRLAERVLGGEITVEGIAPYDDGTT